MITNTLYEPIQKKKSGKESASHSANVFSHSNRSTSFFIFLAYAPVLLAFLAVGVLLWHLRSTTERDLESIKSSLYSMAVVTSKMETEIGELQKLIIESSVSKTFLENRFERLSAQITTLRSDLSSSPLGPASGTPGKMTSALEQPSLYHEVETGDTLYKIARKYGVSVGQLIVTNNLSEKNQIYPGQRILITMGDQSKAPSFTK
jgi:LysM repeat protein